MALQEAEADDSSRLTPGEWARLEAVFRAATECEPSAREDLLDDACDGERGLRAKVESLLQVKTEAAGFIEGLLAGAMDTLEIPAILRPSQSDFAGTERFHIRRKLGAGGFGTVYEAYDSKLDTLV